VNLIDPLGLDVWGCVTVDGEDICGPITFTTSWASASDFTGGVGGSGHPMHAPVQEIGWLREPGGAGGRGIQVRPDGSIWIYQPASQICTNQGGCYDSVEARWVNIKDLSQDDQVKVIFELAASRAEGPVNLAAVGMGGFVVVAGSIAVAPLVPAAGTVVWGYVLTHPGCAEEFVSAFIPSAPTPSPCYAAGSSIYNAYEWINEH
jgi:hypothetical protein